MNHVFPRPYPEICYTTATERNAQMEPLSTLSSPVSFALLRYIRRVPGDVML